MITELRVELERTRNDISDAAAKDASLAGGLTKALVLARLELLKTTEVLLQQRIQSVESGAPLTVQIPATKPDPEMAASLEQEVETQQRVLDAARADAARFTGGLVHALMLSTVATQEQSLAMLRQRYLIARYGLGFPQVAILGLYPDTSAITPSSPLAKAPDRSSSDAILTVRLLKKQFTNQNYQDYVFFDIEFAAPGLKRPARAIKGRLNLNDLFGETKMTVEWTVAKPPNPGGTVIERGTGFEYNQFMNPHQWVNSTALENMSATFSVSSILYHDGSREDLP